MLSLAITSNIRKMVAAFKLGPQGGTHSTGNHQLLVGVLLGCVSTDVTGAKSPSLAGQLASHLGAGVSTTKKARAVRDQLMLTKCWQKGIRLTTRATRSDKRDLSPL